MKQKSNNLLFNRYLKGGFGVLVIAIAALSVFIVMRGSTDAAPKPTAALPASIPSDFSFSGMAGWWQGATNKTSMAVFQDSHNCFVSVQYNTGIVDTASVLQESETSLTSVGYTVTPGTVQAVSLQTNAGQQSYQLHQYAVSGDGGEGQLEGGQEFGYLQFSGGYLKIEGYCNTSDQLSATVSALQAIKYSE